jgi:hypothetical protein
VPFDSCAWCCAEEKGHTIGRQRVVIVTTTLIEAVFLRFHYASSSDIRETLMVDPAAMRPVPFPRVIAHASHSVNVLLTRGLPASKISGFPWRP